MEAQPPNLMNLNAGKRPDVITRGVKLAQVSLKLLRENPVLIVLPLLSGILTFIAVAVLFGGTTYLLWDRVGENLVFFAAAIACAYPVTYISVFANVALAAGVNSAMDGGKPTVRGSLAAAWRRKGVIALWALISATVGVAIRAIVERVPGIGAIVIQLVAGIAWAVATMLAVPVIVLEDRKGFGIAKRSGGLMKSMWPEGVIGSTGIGIFFIVPLLAVLFVGGAATLAASAIDTPFAWLPVALATAVAFFVVCAIISACETIFTLALFRYATESRPTAGFAAEQFAWLGRPKRTRFGL